MPVYRNDFARWQHLITPDWLHQHLTSHGTLADSPRCWRLLEVGHEESGDFVISHIPGATYLDTQALEEAPYWNKVADSELLRLLLALGVRHDTSVIVYGRNLAAAARAAHLLLYAGVSDVRFLDGGFQGWTRAGFPCASGPVPYGPAETDFGVAFPACPHYLINLPEARKLLQQPGGALVSIRTWDEFTGKTSGYSYIPAKGDIPGALWGHAGRGTDVNDMRDFHDSEKRIRSAQDISSFWHAEGIRCDMQIGFYCGTGWRASLAFYCAWLMGWEHICVFDGGWFEWSQNMPLE
jgi:molybdopterin synthase sulfurtransferase